MTLGAAIRAARLPMTQRQLVEALVASVSLPVDQATVSRWERDLLEPSLAAIAAVERVAGVVPGWVLVAAGFVELPRDTRAAIGLDPALTPDARDWLLAAYDAALSTSAKTRPTTPPT